MEGFNELLHKLEEAHEREVEGWQVKVQELSNKKGCDTKRMEELFSRNQQMREQQRLLTENIKTLENRLRAGLCDRCTVTQEVAKRRQQEYEASQIQSLQHISILAGEMNNLKKENKRLRDEIRSLRGALEGQSEHSSNSTTPEVKPTRSPDLSPSVGPVALITAATSRTSNQPADGDVAVKTDPDQRTEETLSEHRQIRGWNRSLFESYKPLSMSTPTAASWKTEHSVGRGSAGERRTQSIEGLDQRSAIPPHLLLLKNVPHSSSSSSSSSLSSGEVNPSRHVLHTPVPFRPRPVKSSPLSLPWPLSESSDWVTLAASPGNCLVVQPNPKPNPQRFPNLIPTGQQANHCSPGVQGRRQVLGHPWPRRSPPQPLSKEQTLVLRVRSLSEQGESQAKAKEKREMPPSKPERVFGEGLREVYEGPLDLSDRGRSKSSQPPRGDKPLTMQGGEREEESSDRDMKTNPYTHIPVCPSLSSPSSSPLVPPSSSATPPPSQQQEQASGDHNHKEEQEQKEEANGKADQTNGKKVPVLTISLRPVVLLETLNCALQKQESLSSNGKSSSPTAEPGSSSEEQDGEESVSGQESSQGSKRKRASLDTDTDRDSDIDDAQQLRKIKITVGSEETSSS
ncbi:uncharacterized protein rbbp8l [Centroberyx gerrardi]|uniref:uncharacterized protein rbbp8l n=1 Tax=Centroberyx gerrardi TaxID=166262 RepID=UPI003AB0C282